ncbi:ribosome small subunit-dependent GTPase A [Rurimicrobium arvi]|uniref:Small ribosomal subunit biogenesis GTPase RsgA n=1 Tax=Rurimicrobium arvi TaxID=2049916 RepID=A0ABP8MXN1_9BACT
MEGLVYKSTGSWYQVHIAAQGMVPARIKGRMKVDKSISSTNPVAVGDKVQIEKDPQQEDWMITHILDRENYIARVSPHNRHQKHIVASNLDLAVMIATIAHPATSLGFIDRFLVTAEAYHIPTLIAFNKTDLLNDEGTGMLDYLSQVYTDAGYDVLPVSAVDGSGMNELRAALAGKTALFSGHSGVGKSTLINELVPDLNLRTDVISDYSGKGQHTTTFAEMFDLPGGGHIIDTPGVKEFGIIDMEQDELAGYFPEMRRLMHACKFNNCQHINEPGCAVKHGLETHEVSPERYISYQSIRESIEKQW